MRMYLADMHTHTQISPDSGARLVDMARAAAAAGLDELYVTDHCDLLDGEGRFAPDFDWPAALAQMAQAREGLTGRLQLRLGLELGSAPFDPAAARKLLTGAGEALDFVLGSLHNWVGAEENIDFYYTDFSGGLAQCRRALENALDSTWALVTDCPDCYDSLAHIVYPLRYMARDGQALSLADYEERVRDIFTQVARTDHALEVNTNRGQDLEVWPQVLGWFRDCGGRYVTIGSDAHRPQDVAAGIREGTELVRQAGFAGVTTYVRRRPVIHPF